MKADDLIYYLTAPHDFEKAEGRDVVRIAQARMRFVDGHWEFDPPRSSTYYTAREVEKPKRKQPTRCS